MTWEIIGVGIALLVAVIGGVWKLSGQMNDLKTMFQVHKAEIAGELRLIENKHEALKASCHKETA